MLLPDVAEAQASNNMEHVRYTSASTVKYCILLGILCTGIFLSFGNRLGLLLFHNKLAGSFIITLAWICPFLYLSTTLSSILNGLGKTLSTFINNIVALSIRILFIIFAVPVLGIAGYLWGLLLSQLVITLLSLLLLNTYAKIQLPIQLWLIKPICSIFIAIGIAFYSNMLFDRITGFPELLNVFICCLILSFIYFTLLFFWGVLTELFQHPNLLKKKYRFRVK